jgi:polyhydroxybutyrate depolymerase
MNVMARPLFTAALLFLVAGSGHAETREFRVRVAGVERSYLVHVPSDRLKEGSRWPLVVLLHGGGGNARQGMMSSGMNEVADRNRFLVAYPNGTGRSEDILLTWNSGNCCGYAMSHDVDDVQFVRAMVEKIGRDFAIDRKRIYATGMSNGGMMTYRLGCEASDLFAAIAPVAGALNIDCSPSHAVAVLIFHGTADEHVPYEGGTGASALEERVDKPVSYATRLWQTSNGCTRASSPKRKGDITRQTWSGCRDGADVALVTIHGGGHAWPGGATPRRRMADAPTQEISASEEMWQFFAAHPRK